jgi:hypothetical protein
VIEIGGAPSVAEEEDRPDAADDVLVPFLGMELPGKAADVPLGVGRAAFASGGRGSNEGSVFLPIAEKIGALL